LRRIDRSCRLTNAKIDLEANLEKVFSMACTGP
jgi:hypothetical protein